MPAELDVPIAFLVFNRPELTKQVFACIRAARPKELFVIADGPRHADEEAACHRTREIATDVDWDCVLHTNFSEPNLGCGKRVSSGLTWLFEHCEQAIILEDDCLPDPTFFLFCAELLAKYRDDDKVAMISGDNFLQGYPEAGKSSDSYYFSQFTHIWGWATWRRAWNNYDFEMKDWPAARETGWLRQTFGSGPQSEMWRGNFDAVHSRALDTWDFQWQYVILRHNACVALPAVNLISNIGFGESATHTKVATSQARLETGSIVFPLNHPNVVARDVARDLYTFETVFNAPSSNRSVLNQLKSVVRRIGSRCVRLMSMKPSGSQI